MNKQEKIDLIRDSLREIIENSHLEDIDNETLDRYTDVLVEETLRDIRRYESLPLVDRYKSILIVIAGTIRDYDNAKKYPEKLHKQYAIWYEDYDVGPKMVINAEDYDVHRDEDWAEVYELIQEELQERGLIDEDCEQA